MLNEIYSDAETRMDKSIESLHHELGKLRTGRAHPSLLESIMVPYYGNDTPLSQVAGVTVGDSRTLVVSPWEKNMMAPIEKAIMTSDLGLNPATSSGIIRVPLPPLTEERRKELIRVVKASVENAKVSIRNVRRDANTRIKDLLKEKLIAEDEGHRAEEKIQALTDKKIADIDKTSSTKEADLMEV